jgi:hypothetical protein
MLVLFKVALEGPAACSVEIAALVVVVVDSYTEADRTAETLILRFFLRLLEQQQEDR